MPSHNLHKIPNTFTRRTLKILTNSPLLLQKFNLKRLSVKNIQIVANNFNNYLKNLHEQRLNKTLLKTVHKAEISTCLRLYFLQAIKPVKTLHQVTFQFSSESVKTHFPAYLKKIPKYMNAVTVDRKVKSDNPNLLYKNLARLPHLERLTRKINKNQNLEDLGFMREESTSLKHYLPKMPRLKDYKFSQGSNHQYELQSLLQRENKPWPWLTMLSLHLKLPEIGVLIGQIPDEEENNEAPLDETEPKRFPALFKYSLFPNLKHIDLTIGPSLNIWIPRSVTKEFQSLRNIQSISFVFKARPRGTTFLLLGLFELPLLDHFTLNIPFLYKQEWSSLDTFFQKQSQLSLVHLEIPTKRPSKSVYAVYENHIKNLSTFLQNKPLLKDLRLIFPFASLESISDALKNQKTSLFSLNIHSFEGPEGSPKENLKGLSEFIKKQKNLRSLEISLGYVISAEILMGIFEAISELKELTELKVHVNCEKMVRIEDYERYYDMVINVEGNKGERFGRWKSSLARAIGKLEKIETLELRIKGLEDESQSENWCLGFLKIIGGCERLRTFVFGVPVPGKEEGIMEEVCRILGEFKRVDVKFETNGRPIGTSSNISIAKATARVSFEKSLNTDLMF